jgi:hypothetical protein
MALTIDGTAFRLPNDVKIDIVKQYAKARSANGTLVTSVLNFTEKRVYKFTYVTLTDAEYTFLVSKNFQVKNVTLTDSGYAFNTNFFIEFDQYSWQFSQRKGLTLTLTEV